MLDLSRVLAGPWCTQILADLGADVIKIEKPGQPATTRAPGARRGCSDADGRDTAEAAYYLACNRGKRSVAVDFTQPEGQRDRARAGARRPTCWSRTSRSAGWRSTASTTPASPAINPRLVYCSITGFGQDGPYAARAGYDFIIQGMGGLMSVTGERDDVPGGGPQKVGVAISRPDDRHVRAVGDPGRARASRPHAARASTSTLALLDSTVAMMAVMNMNYLVSGKPPGRRRQRAPQHRALPGLRLRRRPPDPRRRQRRPVREVLRGGRAFPVSAADPRFAKNADRVAHRGQLVPLVAGGAARRARSATGSTALEPAGVPCGPINRLDQVFADPQVIARGMRVDLPHPLAGTVPQVGNPVRFSATPSSYGRAPPLLGEHTAEMLGERLGFADAAIAELARGASSASADVAPTRAARRLRHADPVGHDPVVGAVRHVDAGPRRPGDHLPVQRRWWISSLCAASASRISASRASRRSSRP